MFLPSVVLSQAQAPIIDPYSLQDRVEHLEHLVSGKKEVDLLTKFNQQQEELRELRGQIEQQTYQIEQLKKSQSQLYMDLENRLTVLEPKK